MKLVRMIAFVFACVLFASACGKDNGVSQTPDGGATSTVPGVGPVAPLTGLSLKDDDIRNRTLLTIKVDNHPEARPQWGIDRADVIIEEKVEGGLSRFMALFQSQDADKVGPVRSLRTTDPKWLKPEGGMIAYSGGIDQVKALLKPNGIVDLGADSHGTKYYKRRSDRPFEHSMYTITPVLREETPKNAPTAKALWEFLKPGETFNGAGVVPVASVSVRMDGGSTATFFDWTWNPEKGAFMRGTEGKAHEFEGAGQIAMKNVIVQFTPYKPTQWRDRANSVVDEASVVGSGEAWVLSDGKMIKGTWSRPTDSDVTKYLDSTGAPIKLQPGKTWVSLVPPGQPTQVR